MGRPRAAVVIPARDEERTVGDIVRALAAVGDPIEEIVVVDDQSRDATAAVAARAGARVVDARHVLPEHDRGPGKGQALWRGLASTSSDVVVFCDADLEDFDPSFVTRLVHALAADDDLSLVKARYGRAGAGGRVTELTARPVLDLLFPELAHVRQPLAGEYAAWRSVLEAVPFVHGYGVDLGLLLDVGRAFGSDSIGQVDLGVRHHRNRSLSDLRPQAFTVLAVALDRAGLPGVSVDELPPLRELRRGAA